jgi:hypothetical protein
MQKIQLQALLAGLLLLCISGTTAANATQSAIKKVYYQWCSAIGTAKGNSAAIIKFYAPNAILLPTLSAKILVNQHGGLDAYFKKLTNYPHIKCTTKKLITHVHGEIATNSGLYQFSYNEKNGKKIVLPARFTFVYKKFTHKWLIIKHHSSATPY